MWVCIVHGSTLYNAKYGNCLEDLGEMEAQMHVAYCKLDSSGGSSAYRMFSKECLFRMNTCGRSGMEPGLDRGRR